MPIIALDADDTLWHNEPLFVDTQRAFAAMLQETTSPDRIRQTINDTERRNIELYGYGIKGYALSLMEAAIE